MMEPDLSAPSSSAGNDRLRIQECEDNANRLPFHVLCKQFQRIADARTRNDKLSKFFSAGMRELLKGQSMFPLVRLLAPTLDRERPAYGLREKNTAKLYVEHFFHGNSQHEDSQRLMFFNDPNINRGGNGDFPDTLEAVIKHRVGLKTEKSSWTVGQVNELLDSIGQADKAMKRYYVGKIARGFSAEEQKWLMRIIFKDLKIGLSKDHILAHLHPDAKEYYNKTTNLREVCVVFGHKNSDERVASMIAVFTPFKPMLAGSFKNNLNNIEQAMNGNAFVMELKLDGERMLCHKQGNKMEWWTRNIKKAPETYGFRMEKFIKEAVAAECVILDGEIAVWDNELGEMAPFRSNKTVAQKEDHRQLFYILFDVLYLAGEGAAEVLGPLGLRAGSLTAAPLRLRRRALRALLRKETPHRLELCHGLEVPALIGLEKNKNAQATATSQERREKLLDYYTKAVEGKEEGLVVKDLESRYVTGNSSKKTNHWIKMKPEYSDQTTNLDLVVLGAYYGEGRRRAGLLSHFLLGLADERSAGGDGRPTKFFTFGKVGTGYSLKELEDLNAKLEDHFVTFNPHKPPPVEWHPWKIGKRDDIPNKWIPPNKSVIFEVKCAEIVDSNQFSANWTLRFPRVECIRYDKDWHEAMTFSEMENARENFRSAAAQLSMMTVGAGKRRQKKKPGRRKSLKRGGKCVASHFLLADLENIEQASTIFENLEFCFLQGNYEVEEDSDDEDWTQQQESERHVPKGPKTYTKSELDRVATAHGAHVVANPQATTDHVVAPGPELFLVRSLARGGRHDVLSFHWVLECLEQKRHEPPSHGHYIHMTAETKEKFGKIVDEYGDPFYEEKDASHLKKVLDEVERQRKTKKSSYSLKRRWEDLYWEDQLDKELADAMETSSNFFWQSKSVYYVDMYTDLGGIEPNSSHDQVDKDRKEKNSKLDITSMKLQFYGGRVVSALNMDVSHIIIDPESFSRREEVRERLKEMRRLRNSAYEPQVLCLGWVDDSITAGYYQRYDTPVSRQHRVDMSELGFTQNMLALARAGSSWYGCPRESLGSLSREGSLFSSSQNNTQQSQQGPPDLDVLPSPPRAASSPGNGRRW